MVTELLQRKEDQHKDMGFFAQEDTDQLRRMIALNLGLNINIQ
jgi:hypothetical protein